MNVDRETVEGVLFALPYLLVFSVFLLYPLLKGLRMSLYDWNPIFPSQSEFIWFQNYVRMFNDPVFWTSVKNTFYFVVLTVPPLVVLGLLLALGVNREVKGQRFLRAVFFSPYILTVSVVALVWMEIFAPQYGLLNYYLELFVASAPAWLSSYLFAMPAVAIATIWWTLGFNFVILFSARQNVPERLYEAAKLDGASNWRMLRDITIPQMKPALVFVTIVQFIASFQIFGQVYIMTGGGPGNSTQTLVMYLYEIAFQQHEFGYAAAVGYFLFAVLITVSLANYFLLGGDQ
ncbi:MULTISPECIES: carbohydrate ABC transporter permease [Halorussus]|uniref:carbohydrate ABC transporter permease n=1 Tax=Halorussus TaxID=1070314 RepID=UPI0020A009F9|nr:sugar ABC transporter permease [Halorussus vallis]USZ77371.1 sugar ABC transporter permease [Halorussus vallis]